MVRCIEVGFVEAWQVGWGRILYVMVSWVMLRTGVAGALWCVMVLCVKVSWVLLWSGVAGEVCFGVVCFVQDR